MITFSNIYLKEAIDALLSRYSNPSSLKVPVEASAYKYLVPAITGILIF
jgi:hypothetical protein